MNSNLKFSQFNMCQLLHILLSFFKTSGRVRTNQPHVNSPANPTSIGTFNDTENVVINGGTFVNMTIICGKYTSGLLSVSDPNNFRQNLEGIRTTLVSDSDRLSFVSVPDRSDHISY